MAPTATEEIDEKVTRKAAEESAAFLVTQFQMAQTIRGRELALSFAERPRRSGNNHRIFRFKNSGDQVVRTPAAANVNPGSRGAYQVTVGIERVQETRLIEASIWLDAQMGRPKSAPSAEVTAFIQLSHRPAKPGRHRDAYFPSTKLTSTPFLTDFANRSTSQFVILTQPCDSDLLIRDGSAVP